jgi:hypothetical protein
LETGVTLVHVDWFCRLYSSTSPLDALVTPISPPPVVLLASAINTGSDRLVFALVVFCLLKMHTLRSSPWAKSNRHRHRQVPEKGTQQFGLHPFAKSLMEA